MTDLQTAANDFLAQKRIAIAGVSRSEKETANMIYKRFRSAGYQVFPVNPNAQTVEGDPCYPDIKSIPGGVDAVLIVTHPSVSAQVVRDCAEAGVKRVWMHEGMGGSVSDEAVALCRENGISVIPGACPLMFGPTADFGHKCIRWWLGLTGKLPQITTN
jgi:predicted CoA-binding protein